MGPACAALSSAGSISAFRKWRFMCALNPTCVVHVLSQKAREYYSLERLWREAKIVPIPAE